MSLILGRAAMMRAAALLPASMAFGFAWTPPAMADEVTDLIAACEPFMTVQYEQCEVESYARCPDGGTLVLEDRLGEATSASLVTADRGLVFGYDSEGVGILGVIETQDPISTRELIETGFDNFEMTVEARLLFPHPQQGLFQGWFRPDGGEVTIDGRKLRTLSTEQELEMGVGGQMAVARGTVYWDAELGTTYDGVLSLSFAGVELGLNGSAPADFIFPGEPGFYSSTPAIGCGPNLSKASR